MIEMKVSGMTCEHCVNAVRSAVAAIPGVAGVAVDLAAGTVRVEGSPDPAALRAAIEEEGYALA